MTCVAYEENNVDDQTWEMWFDKRKEMHDSRIE